MTPLLSNLAAPPPHVSPAWFREERRSARRAACLKLFFAFIASFVIVALILGLQCLLKSFFLSAVLGLALLLFTLYCLTLALVFPGSNAIFQWHTQQQLGSEAASELLSRLRSLELYLLYLLSLPFPGISEKQKKDVILSASKSCLARYLATPIVCTRRGVLPLLSFPGAARESVAFAVSDAAASRASLSECYLFLASHLLSLQELHLKADALLRLQQQRQQQDAAAGAGDAAASSGTPGWIEQQKARTALSWLQEALAFSVASLLSHLAAISLTQSPPSAEDASCLLEAPSKASAPRSRGGASAALSPPPLAALRLATPADILSCAAALNHLQAVALLLLPFQSTQQQTGGSSQQQQLLLQKKPFVARVLLLLFRFLAAQPLVSPPLLQQQAARGGAFGTATEGVEVWLPVLQQRRRACLAAAFCKAWTAAAARLRRLLPPALRLLWPPPSKVVYIQCLFVPAPGSHWLLPSSCCCPPAVAAAAAEAAPYDFCYPPSRCCCSRQSGAVAPAASHLASPEFPPFKQQKQQQEGSRACGAATALLAAARSACSSPFKRLLGSISPLHEHQQHHRGADRTAAETEGLLADAENSDEGSCRLPLRFTCGCSTNQHPRISSAAAAAAAHVPIGGDIVIAFNPNAGSIEMALAGGSPEMESYLKKGFSVLISNYRGCSSSAGSISLPSVLNDAVSIYKFAAGLIGARRTALHGRSIGGLPATYAACVASILQQRQQRVAAAAAAAAIALPSCAVATREVSASSSSTTCSTADPSSEGSMSRADAALAPVEFLCVDRSFSSLDKAAETLFGWEASLAVRVTARVSALASDSWSSTSDSFCSSCGMLTQARNEVHCSVCRELLLTLKEEGSSSSSSSSSSAGHCGKVAATATATAAATASAAAAAAAECMQRACSASAFDAVRCRKVIIASPHDEIIGECASLKNQPLPGLPSCAAFSV
ncbi:uncharacterized protein LOC34621050 [Cyclospora cayetanensis]|uniref:Uncharacterized protein LOC34621050 n=1 Tax=Cyclospora cayetanensis TaxID=88456 RepID=A0A6P6RPT3_9EIME|nr:uncharacterized protein LOC34621050 [Cyclospora cayetanensis]